MKERSNMILSLAGMGVSGIGSNLYAFAISFYILSVTGSSTSFAMSLILSVLPRVVLNPFVGNLVDRVNKKAVVVLADCMSGLIMIGLVVLSMGNDLSLMLIYSATFLLSVSNVFLGNAYSASYANIVTEKLLTKLNSFQQTIQAIIQIGSPILGGIVYALVDIRLFILINGLSFFASAVSELFIDFKFNSKLVDTQRPKNSFMENFVEGFRYVKSQKMFISLALYALVVNFFVSAFSVIMPYTLITVHAFDSNLVGYVQAAFPVGMLIASIVIGQKNLKFSKNLFGGGIMMFAVVFILFSIPSLPNVDFGFMTPFYYGLIFMVMAATAVSINVPLGVKFQTSVDEAYRGRFFGFLGMMAEGIIPLAYLLFGFLIGILPTYVILYISTTALFILAVSIKRNKYLDDEIKPVETLETTKVVESIEVS